MASQTEIIGSQELRRVLSMEVDADTESEYRIQVNDQVKYVVVQPGVYDFDEVLSFPPALLKNLPPFPSGNWTSMNVSRDKDGAPVYIVSSTPLKAVTRVWHPELVDILSLRETGRFGARVRIVEKGGREFVAKIARFDFEIGLVENETRVYEKLAQENINHPDRAAISPDFCGHLIENGRVMGMLIEKLEGRRANIEDISACEAAVKRLHAVGVLHGDVNRHNFVVDEQSGVVRLIDFENAKDYDVVKAREEIDSLKQQLVEDTGRGGQEATPSS
ncbi:alpha-galactosidase A [Rhexocercosporidium sp. MPI-PUGE-AT-0058]|nr:alpha-galactosidase A [Rhexocercosporidium sp. MPI-PUGE-AT-0058]